MKKTRDTFRKIGLLITLTGITLCLAGNAFANTAANHIIRNTVTVNFDDAGGSPQTAVTATVDITVSLVASAPALSAPSDGITDSGTPEDYIYTLTATANGPDTYQLAEDSLGETADIIGSTSAFLYDDPNTAAIGDYIAIPSDQLTLGATTVADASGTIVASGNTTINVPNDNTNDSIVNGIEAGDFVVINNQVFEVASVDDSNWGTPNGTSSITVVGNGTATAIVITNLIAEQQEFLLRVTPGTVTDTSDQEITVNISVDGGTPDETITTVQVAALQVTKEVAVDPSNTGDDSGGYQAVATNAAPLNTLIYRITVTNNGSANATSVVITDPLVDFTVYTATSAKASSTSGDTYAAAPTVLTDDALLPVPDGYDFTAGLATYDVGTIPAGESRLLFFQVTVQ